METNKENKLNRYELTNEVLYTGFADFNAAELYAKEKNGKLVEVAFKDGNDNPVETSEADLIEKKLHYFVDAGPEYKFIHSSDEGFKQYADELQKIKAKLNQSPPDERYLANFEIENAEDPIVVLKNDQFESVTSRERSKYLKHANVYEIAVSIAKAGL
ncbi:hypothetical protein ASG31_11855 [Chryseobacterium sp. Leaf404]|uniref:hypothetical protein n=1 Tax=unclassified Chryseobacterium TaxID=2593645 RepID=UPI0006FE214B|nr:MULTISPECIES: hypothetical protein [unclassified Chryseobacterium]KQT17153.1 hypothetical protein ASG31_11855 [Chryseobacterium sp. Leaf404]